MANAIANIGTELEEFETPYVPVQITPIRWSVEKYEVAQMLALEGKTKNAISKETGIPLHTINNWLKHPEFNDYINKTVVEKATLLKGKRLKMLTKILDAREEQAEVEGYAGASRKDTVEIITEIRKETGDEKSVDSSYMGLLEKLVANSLKQPKFIDVESN